MNTQLERVQSMFASESLEELEAALLTGKRENYRGFYRLQRFARLNTLIQDNIPLIDPPSSDEDSDSGRSGPTVHTVTDAILDSQMTKISVFLT
jgi:hypothetical protein